LIGCGHRQLLKLHFAHPHRIEADLPQTRHHQAFLQPNSLQVPKSLFAELSAGSNRFFLAHLLGWQVSVHHLATIKHCVGLDSFLVQPPDQSAILNRPVHKLAHLVFL